MDPPFFCGGSLSLVLVVLAWLLQLFRFVQVTWVSWTFCLGFFLSTSSVLLIVQSGLDLCFSFVLSPLWLCVCQDCFCEQLLLASAFEAPQSCLVLALRFFLDGFMVLTRCPSISKFRLVFFFPSFGSGGTSFGDIL